MVLQSSTKMAMDPVDDETCVAKLVAQYFQLVEPRELCVPSAEAIVRPAVQAAIYEQMFNEATVWPLPPAGYRTRVLKMIISRIEESISNPEEDVRRPSLSCFLANHIASFLSLVYTRISLRLHRYG